MIRPKFNNTSVTVIASIVFAAFLFLLPTGFEGALQFRDAVKCKALVEEVDNSRIIDTGLIRTGQQVCSVRFLTGQFMGMTGHGWDML